MSLSRELGIYYRTLQAMMPASDFRLYQAHRLLEPPDWRLGTAIACQSPRLLRPAEFNLLPPDVESERMQASLQSRLGDGMFVTEDEQDASDGDSPEIGQNHEDQ